MNFIARIAHRFAHAPLIAGSFLFLTAAKGDGCSTVVVEEPACEAGFHTEEVCVTGPIDYCGPDEDCVTEPGVEECSLTCVPDSVCPEGMVEQIECAQPLIACADGEDCDLPPADCFTTCVPIDEPCPAGQHLETQCYEVDCLAVEGVDCGGGGACEDVCVPDSFCPPGTQETYVCAEPPVSGCMPEEPLAPCELACVPVDPSCGPGQHLETQCQGNVCQEGEPCPEIAECFDVCVDDGLCPEGMVQVVECIEGSDGPCSITCVSGDDPVEPPTVEPARN